VSLKFSIITVCYNSEKTIERTILSVLAQTYQNFEYIIVDGASTDGTIDIIKGYKDKYPCKIKIISEKDDGIYDAMNKGIKLATGDLIGIVNSDDYYEQDALDNVLQVYDEKKYEIIYGMLRTLKNDKEVSIYIKNHQWIEEDMITHPTCFVTRAVYEDYGVYSLEYPFSADYEFMLRMSRNHQVTFQPVYKIISNFSLDGASASIYGYIDTLKLKHLYGLISSRSFFLKITRCKLLVIYKILKSRLAWLRTLRGKY